VAVFRCNFKRFFEELQPKCRSGATPPEGELKGTGLNGRVDRRRRIDSAIDSFDILDTIVHHRGKSQ